MATIDLQLSASRPCRAALQEGWDMEIIPIWEINDAAYIHGCSPMRMKQCLRCFTDCSLVLLDFLRQPGAWINGSMHNHKQYNEDGFHSLFIPILVAAKDGFLPLMELLLQHPAIDVNKSTNGLGPALSRACAIGNLPMVEALLRHPDVDVNWSTRFCECALAQAARFGQLTAAQLLLQHPQIDINIGYFPKSCKDIRDWNRTALAAAVFHPREDFVRLLLDHSQQTGTPLHDMVRAWRCAAANHGSRSSTAVLLRSNFSRRDHFQLHCQRCMAVIIVGGIICTMIAVVVLLALHAAMIV